VPVTTRLLPLLLVLAVAPAARAADLGMSALAPPRDGRPHLQAVRVERPPVIDGRLDDHVWGAVAASDAFTQKFPREGEPPTEKTHLRVAYDDEAIYFALDCQQRLAPVARRLTRRDRLVEADWVSIAIDTRRDGRSGFDFTVSAAGVLTDSIRFDDTEVSADWDENWEARTDVSERGWSAEIRVPLRILRFAALPAQSWGLQARRYVSDRQETDEWAFIPRSSAGEVSLYGRLDDLHELKPGRRLELNPFVSGRYRRRDLHTGQLASGTDFGAAAGLDLKWHPSQELTVDAAFLPDFAQVEADQVVLNLTNFETVYPEKRRFFLEGIDTFATPEVSLLYTRRIGRAAPSPALRDGESLVDVPSPATIYGAGKLTGRLGTAWEVGALAAVTAPNAVDVQQPDGQRERRVVDPLSAFGVLRLRRAAGSNGYVGLMGTSVLRFDRQEVGALVTTDPAAPAPYVLCPDGRQVAPGRRCSNDAHVAGLDWRWRSPSGTYVTSGQAIGSMLLHGPPREIVDGAIIRSGDLGGSVHAAVGKEAGAHWLWRLWGAIDTRKLDVNDLGYNDRANQYGFGGEVSFRTLSPWAHTLETRTKLEPIALNNIDGLPIQRTLLLLANARLSSYWTLTAGLQGFQRHFDDREVGTGAALERSGGGDAILGVETDPRARLSARLNVSGELVSRGRALRGELALLVRPLSQLDLELIPQAVYARGEPRYADTAANGDYVFGRLDARSAGATLRATYTFTPTLTLQTYAQLFLASRHYYDLSTFSPATAGPRPAIHLGDLRPGAPALAANPDSRETALNANVVLRWEFHPGSLLYLVYTRSQAPEVTLMPGEVGKLDLGSLRRAPAADVLLLKLSYWWS
jgi:hypothetical protein